MGFLGIILLRAGEKRTISKDHILYDSIYVTVLKEMKGCQGLGMVGGKKVRMAQRVALGPSLH